MLRDNVADMQRTYSSHVIATGASRTCLPSLLGLSHAASKAAGEVALRQRPFRDHYSVGVMEIRVDTIYAVVRGLRSRKRNMEEDSDRHPGNAPGDWYIDRRCIDCGASHSVAPELIEHRAGQCVFVRQPVTETEIEAAWRAVLVCPTASVRRESGGSPPPDLFPHAIAAGVYRCGYNARSSYGAHAYFVERPSGNVLIDAPRWSRRVNAFISAHHGVDHIFLTHRDDVADAEKYAKAFGAQVWIHERDADAAPFANHLLRGGSIIQPLPGWQAIPVPGHTAGSVVYLLEDTFLFSGDSLAWSFAKQRLVALRDACWHSWAEQTRSLERLLEYEFEWVLAGHGGSVNLPRVSMRDQLQALVRWTSS